MSKYTIFKYSRKKVNEAGATLINPLASLADMDEAYKIANNWRSSHSWPMNVLYMIVKRAAAIFGTNIPVVQRLKRMHSIQRKLTLLKRKNLTLSKMQDIAGCRAIAKDVKAVYDLVQRIKSSHIKHRFEWCDDYIASPKVKSGYRGVHLIYSYFSDKNKYYNGHRIEIQLRTPLQHAWATAVETVDTFTNQVLKSNQGTKPWKKFFKLMSTVIALHEKTKPAPDTPADISKIKIILLNYPEQIKTIRSINQSGHILPHLLEQDKESYYFLLILNSTQRTATVRGFSKADNKIATEQYLQAERDNASRPNIDVVLVSTETIKILQSTYTNYFLDIREFAKILEKTLEG
jgi:ppGpp synthetase/RelA/SpoT-type nucleotidyltranferase